MIEKIIFEPSGFDLTFCHQKEIFYSFICITLLAISIHSFHALRKVNIFPNVLYIFCNTLLLFLIPRLQSCLGEWRAKQWIFYFLVKQG